MFSTEDCLPRYAYKVSRLLTRETALLSIHLKLLTDQIASLIMLGKELIGQI